MKKIFLALACIALIQISCSKDDSAPATLVGTVWEAFEGNTDDGVRMELRFIDDSHGTMTHEEYGHGEILYSGTDQFRYTYSNGHLEWDFDVYDTITVTGSKITVSFGSAKVEFKRIS